MRPDSPTLCLRQPLDILAALPYIVGYHPSDSLVVLGMSRRRLVFAARADLPPPDPDGPTIVALVDHLVDVVLSQDCTSVIVVGLGPAERVDELRHVGQCREAVASRQQGRQPFTPAAERSWPDGRRAKRAAPGPPPFAKPR